MSKIYRVKLEKLEIKHIPMTIDIRVPDDTIDDPSELIKEKIDNINTDMCFNLTPYIKQVEHESVANYYTVDLISSLEHTPDTAAVGVREYRDHIIYIYKHSEPLDDPRECWDNLGVMTCFHGRYNLGDKHTLKSDDFSGWDELRSFLINKLHACIILPLYLYDHGGITMSTTPFGCPWDSGQVGFIYATKNAIKSWYSLPRNKPISCDRMSEAEMKLVEEVKLYDKYISEACRDVYCFDAYENSDREVELKLVKLICEDREYYFSEEEAETAAKEIIDHRLEGTND